MVGFDDVNVTAGKFRAIKISDESTAIEGCHCMEKSHKKYHFWYSPDAKATVKFERDPLGYVDSEYMKYELISYELK